MSELEDLDEEDLGNMFTNMRCPPPTVTAAISVPVQGINLSAKSQKRLVVASRAARNYELVVRDLKPPIIKWKVLKELDLQTTALDDKKKQDEPNVSVMKEKDHYFVIWLK